MDVRPPERRFRGARRPERVLLSVALFCAAAVLPAFAQTPSDSFNWRVLIAHGDVAAIEAFAEASPDHPDVPVARALLAWQRGDETAARADLQAASQAGHVDAALELGVILSSIGMRTEARAVFERVGGALQVESDGLSFARTARAVATVGDPRQANVLYRAAVERDAGNPVIYQWWGELFLARHEDAEAARAFRDAIARDARWAPAYLGLSRALAPSDPDAAAAALTQALAIAPEYVDAHLARVDAALDAGSHEAAASALAAVKELAPARYEVIAREAVLALADDRADAFEATAATLVERRPGSGEVFRLAAAAMARQYRFDDAVALGQRAVQADADDPRARAELGLHLSRAGDETAAYQALAHAFRNDPYNPVTYNLLNMLETLGRFASLEHEGVTIRLHADERALLEPYVRDIITRAFDAFETRYGLRPAAPLSVQVFNQHDDFAVRTAGLPGVLTNALGVCFGRVVAMVSPRARRPGTFSWQETLWHELAHVVTLQLSNQRVPRWLTEGISVYEERRGHDGWGREGDVPFAAALAAGRALPLADLERGFRDGRTIGLAYYQASLLVEFIERQYGMDAIRRLLTAFGEGLDTSEAVVRELGVDLASLDERFFVDVRGRYASLVRALDPSRGAETLAGLLAAGDAMLADGNPEGAREAYARAAALVPGATGEASAHLRLADLALQTGDRAAARRALTAALDADYANVELARRLASLSREDGDLATARAAWARVIELDPFDAAAHTETGRAALAEGDLAVAEREFRAALVAGTINLPDAHCDLGELLLAQGRNDEARREAIRALETAPTYERAQELLLKAVGR